MERKIIGFRPSWMESEPDVIETVEALDIQIPDELLQLRQQIAQIATFMASTAFTKLRQEQRMDVILEYTELNSIESGYTRAVYK